MKSFYALTPSAILALSFSCPSVAATEARPGYDPAIEKYVSFLEGQRQGPVDYVLSLFEKYDVVVLCERAHPETTQYDLILDIIRDRRFAEKVGNVFTEVGTASLVPRVDAFLMDSSLLRASPATHHSETSPQNAEKFREKTLWRPSVR